MSAHLGQELVRKDGDVGLLQARRGEDVDDLIGDDGRGDDLADGVIEFLGVALLAGRGLGKHGPHGLEEGHVIADRDRLVVRDGEGEGLRKLRDRFEQPGFAIRPVRGYAPARRAAG